MRILCGGPVSEDADVFEAHITSLKAQSMPMDYKGIDNSPQPIVPPTGFPAVCWRTEPTLGEYKQKRVRWNRERFRLLGRLREEMRIAALDGGYDYLFMVDSDLILGPNTLSLLLDARKDFIAGLFWTRFRPNSRRHWINVWNISDDNVQVPLTIKERDSFKSGGVHEAAITGACSLISRNALGKLSYADRPDVRGGEDICLVLSARAAGIPLYVHCDTSIVPWRRR
jgi:hypothetical protein